MNSETKMAVESVGRPSPQPSRKNNELLHCSTINNTTGVKCQQNQDNGRVYPPPTTTTNVSPEAANQPDAETKALHLLKALGFSYIQQIDWTGKNPEGHWTIVEVKDKELFTPGKNFAYLGAGLDRSQLYLRTQLLNELGLRTYLLVFAKGTNDVYGAYLDELEKGTFYDTPKRIRIYPIDNFVQLNYEQRLQAKEG